MSRRKPENAVSRIYVEVDIVCPNHHFIGRIVRQLGRDIIGLPLERIDGPNGETKVRAVCPTCRLRDPQYKANPQIAWDKVKRVLDDLEARGEEHRAQIHTP